LEPLPELIHSKYGDLIYDLALSVLWSQPGAQAAYPAILRTFRRLGPRERFEKHELAWVLRVTCSRLEQLASRYGRSLSSAERMMLDGALKGEERLRQFDSYFHRLGVPDQILLLLKDKHGIDYDTLASALQTPVATLMLRHQHALRALDEMIWDIP
jgi:DNA-directed RNA polymerase specialized sigma24 family protein